MADSDKPAQLHDEDSNSSQDEDFNPIAADEHDGEGDVSSSSDEDDDNQTTGSRKKKAAPKKRKQPDDEDLDSGDEATINESRKSRKRRKAAEEDSGGEGGLIKTRAQRRVEKRERQELKRANKGEVTIDVDSLWSQLSSAPVGRRPLVDHAVAQALVDNTITTAKGTQAGKPVDSGEALDKPSEDEYIMIKRSYDFAGQTIHEEKRVHRDSAEAKLFLASGAPNGASNPTITALQPGTAFRRPLKRASMFEPNPTGEVKGLPAHRQRLRTPSRADVLAQQKRLDAEAEQQRKGLKLNTVQKSAVDWAAHVDDQGLKDELAEYGRSKQGYMAKMDFLQGVEGRRDQDERAARLVGV